mmetsp:Transcript_5413/g.21359  ORF Transcript_5413/g.21359 Transcript_5413/m.21359 type:complete len:315 (-) Transcript_5413:790-1734(-)
MGLSSWTKTRSARRGTAGSAGACVGDFGTRWPPPSTGTSRGSTGRPRASTPSLTCRRAPTMPTATRSACIRSPRDLTCRSCSPGRTATCASTRGARSTRAPRRWTSSWRARTATRPTAPAWSSCANPPASSCATLSPSTGRAARRWMRGDTLSPSRHACGETRRMAGRLRRACVRRSTCCQSPAIASRRTASGTEVRWGVGKCAARSRMTPRRLESERRRVRGKRPPHHPRCGGDWRGSAKERSGVTVFTIARHLLPRNATVTYITLPGSTRLVRDRPPPRASGPARGRRLWRPRLLLLLARRRLRRPARSAQC